MHDLLNELLTPFFLALGVALCVGLIIGLEREFDAQQKDDHLAGIRTFPLVSILGCLLASLGGIAGYGLLWAAFPAFILFVALTWYSRSKQGHTGLTSEIALIIAFTAGVMAGAHMIRAALGVAVITAALLSLKGTLRSYLALITRPELFAAIKFALIALVILPFLPDRGMGPNALLNPQDIGAVVVIVSAMSFVGYFLVKFIGEGKGILLTALFGGMFSSTSVTWVYAARSREQGATLARPYAAGISIASAVMFVRVAIVTLIFNAAVFSYVVLPCLLMAAVELGSAWFTMRKGVPKGTGKALELRDPLNILNALFFGLLYVGISLAVYYANEWLGDGGLVLSGIISGFADVDAITIAMSKFAMDPTKLRIAMLVIIAAVLSNTLVKLGITVIRGSAEVRKLAGLSTGVTMLAGLLYLLFGSILQPSVP